MRMSVPAFRAAVTASKARPAASAPVSRDTTATPSRSPQIFNCSTAAARNVSPAASMTERPSSRYLAVSFAIVVVLPDPFTPMTRMTNGFAAASITSGCATFASDVSTSVASAARISAGSISRSKRPRDSRVDDARRRPALPRSARSSMSSRSSSAASSSLRLVKTSVMPCPIAPDERDRPDLQPLPPRAFWLRRRQRGRSAGAMPARGVLASGARAAAEQAAEQAGLAALVFTFGHAGKLLSRIHRRDGLI